MSSKLYILLGLVASGCLLIGLSIWLFPQKREQAKQPPVRNLVLTKNEIKLEPAVAGTTVRVPVSFQNLGTEPARILERARFCYPSICVTIELEDKSPIQPNQCGECVLEIDIGDVGAFSTKITLYADDGGLTEFPLTITGVGLEPPIIVP